MQINHEQDGSAGDVDYRTFGIEYARYRQPDPHIARAVEDALGNARTVLNVGAGAGSYEPRDRLVAAVEPAATMRAQRPLDLPEALAAVAEHLPFADQVFDAALASFTVHQWQDLSAGIAELVRVTRGPIVILTGDPAALHTYWLADYLPEVLDQEARRFPSLAVLFELLGPTTRVEHVPVPQDCTDGFGEAYDGALRLVIRP